MYKIEMSPSFGLGYVSRVTALRLAHPAEGATSYSGNTKYNASLFGILSWFDPVGIGPGARHAQTSINIMKGEVPTDFTNLTNYTQRSADTLVITKANEIINPGLVNPFKINTAFHLAAASGLATWFWLRVQLVSVYVAIPANEPIIHQIVGTVGIIGSGSDLEIPDINVVSGTAYRITNLRLNFPFLWPE